MAKKVSAKLLATIKEELLRKKASLTKNITTELDEMRGSEGHHLADMDDLGGDANDEETSFKIIEIETAELNQIDGALERIEDGTYGTCVDCDDAINPDRLEALPFASLCIACKRQREADGADD